MLSMAGSVESCDCLITLYKSETNCIELRSDVIIQYKDQIEKVIFETLKLFNVENVKVVIEDKGALDYTIKERL